MVNKIRQSTDRIIFLVDMNAFFISCEMSRNPALKNRPAAVAGNPATRTGIILAASYEARAFGVRTAMTVHQARTACPELVLVPPDHAFYEQRSAQVMKLLSSFTPLLEQSSIDEAYLDMTGCEGLFGSPSTAAGKIMTSINDKLDLWCSIGISDCKFLAKMAADLKKPHGITELWPKDIATRLWPLPAGQMYGVGRKTAERLSRIGIRTIGDLARAPVAVLTDLAGKSGQVIHRHANGIDPDPVIFQADNLKSIGRSTTLPQDLQDPDQAKPILLSLADRIGRTARQHGRFGRTVQITLKLSDFRVLTRQVQIEPTAATPVIYQTGMQLLRQHWPDSTGVRLIGISLTGFDPDEDRQLSMFDQQMSPGSDRQHRLDKTLDQLRDKLGDNMVKRAQQLKKDKDENLPS